MATKEITITSDVTVNVTTTVQTFDVTFTFQKGYNFMTEYAVTWTSGGLGTAPANISGQTANYTYYGVPYGAAYTVTYTRSLGGSKTQTGVITGPTTVNHTDVYSDYSNYSDYDNSCGCGNE